jgi:hypothetical protein
LLRFAGLQLGRIEIEVVWRFIGFECVTQVLIVAAVRRRLISIFLVVIGR